jgi:hypothetical protein
MNLIKKCCDYIAKKEYVPNPTTHTKLLEVKFLKKLTSKLKMLKQIVLLLFELKKLFIKFIKLIE